MDGYAAQNQRISGTHVETKPLTQYTAQFPQVGVMYNEATPGYFIDHSFYTSGFVAMNEWEENYGSFSPDGHDIHNFAVAPESLSYLYYAPSYGYSESFYNPYNPYIPGAIVGGDGFIVVSDQYESLPAYADSAYMPVVIHPSAGATGNGTPNSFMNNPQSAPKVDVLATKYNFSSKTAKTSASRVREAAGSRKYRAPVSVYDSVKSRASSKVQLALSSQGQELVSRAMGSSDNSQVKSCLTSSDGSHGLDGSSPVCASIDEVDLKQLHGRVSKDAGGNPSTWNGIKNWGSGPQKLKNELVLKAYTLKAGNPDAAGNISIFKDQYNRKDFPVEYTNAKFFVIKSYSEDDVHKSVKYNVWSSTPSGNKKLNAAYEGSQRITAGDSKGCPIFLFFSVNASGQFCGVAEMTGPVDFEADMDFWQQDKWSGSFPVKWHIIKDMPNNFFRHIILRSNEYKPVTNSRDTQEIPLEKGLEMLQIFRNSTSKTCLLDDFMYYEDRQRVLLEERADLKRIAVDLNVNESISSLGDANSLADDSVREHYLSVDDNVKGNSQPSLAKIKPKAAESVGGALPAPAGSDTNCSPSNVITIGSMPVSFSGSSSFLASANK